MAVFNFPDSPNVNDVYTDNGISWKWTGTVWKKLTQLGSKGDKGDGDKGDKGEKGDKGDKGEKGQKGQDGATADKGDKGDKGEKGQKGDAGVEGDKGIKGELGADGSKGQKGDKGEKGEKGVKGELGTGTGTADKIFEGNTEAEVVDTGTNGHFKVTTEGSERLRITGIGSVGIGVDSPDSALHVESGSPVGINAHLGGSYTDNGQVAVRRIEFGTINYRNAIQSQQGAGGNNFTISDLLLNPSGGNVGINSTEPRARLDIQGKAFITDTGGDVLSLESTVNTSRTTLKLFTNGNDWELGARGSSGNPDNSFYIYSNDTSIGQKYRMVINPSGNVGFGTINADAAVEVSNIAKLSVGIVSAYKLYGDGSALTGISGGGGGVDIGTTAPGSASSGDLWWDSDEGDLYVYYDDGNSSQWVAATSPQATKGQKGESGSGGVSDKIEEGNTSAEVIDTGTDGKFVVKTEGVERIIVDPSGYLNTRADIRLSLIHI